MRLKDEIKTKEGKPRVIDSSERVQRVLRRVKVVNNRVNVINHAQLPMIYDNLSYLITYIKW